MKKKILITGAGGFIGSELVNGFCNLNYELIALDQIFNYPILKRKNIFIYQKNLFKYEKNTFNNIDYYIHGAAITNPKKKKNNNLVAKNYLLTKKSLQIARYLKVKKFFFISSTGIYRSNKDSIFNEKSDVFSINDYCKSKLLSEKMIINFCKKNNINFKILRLGNIYSGYEIKIWSRKNTSIFQKWLNSAKKNIPLKTNSFLTKRDWTYIKDIPLVLDAIIKSKNKRLKIINLVSPYIKTDIQMMKIISDNINQKYNFKEKNLSTISNNASKSLYLKNFKFNKWTSPHKAIIQIGKNI